GGRVGRAAVGAAALALAVAGWVGSRRLRVRELHARWPDLPAGLDGTRIAQLSDLHVGPQTSRRFLARVRRAVERSRADVVVLTGDLIDDHPPDVAHLAAALGTLSAPLGVYAVPGNHDVYAGWPAVAARLAALPLTVLVNDAAVVERGGSRLAVVGLGDPAGRGGPAGPDAARALARVPAGAFPVALAHNPALWPELAARGVRLTLSGHTHWGQLALPERGWSLATPFLRDLVMGAHRRAESLLYIAPGTGFWGIPFRLGAWPEVTVVTLGRGGSVEIVEGGISLG
ncbi:MAG: FIG006285: ICC-like protein phosphoesterase, partial [uncultured Gemmatimonadaceae bacterium]